MKNLLNLSHLSVFEAKVCKASAKAGHDSISPLPWLRLLYPRYEYI